MSRYATYAISLCAAIFVWEHISHIFSFWFSPVFLLGLLRDKAVLVAEQVGRLWAYISSYIELLKLQDLAETAWRLLRATFSIGYDSSIAFIKGYIDIILKYNWNTVTIAAGSIGVIGILLSLCYYFIIYRKQPIRPVITLEKRQA